MIGLTINKLSFNDGTQIDLTSTDIVVFVGPNNMGKSQSLRDIFNSISYDHGNIVITDVGVEFHNPDKLEKEVECSSLKSPFGKDYFYKGYNYQIISSTIHNFGKVKFVDENIKKYLVSKVNTEDRLTTSSQKQMVNPGEARQYPLQYVTDSENREKMSALFEKIFSKRIFCEDRGSTMLTLHLGEEIDFDKTNMTAQQVSDKLYQQIASLPKVQDQGDGIRSLAGLMLNLMMPNYTVFLLDEPEAFLHPPQARVLGENLAGSIGNRQTFISTHSIELIKGLLSTAGNRVKIIRLTREGNVNPVHYMSSDVLNPIWKDPLLRHSNILDGLFYHYTVLCESDSDCQLYAAMYGHIKEQQNTYSDALFTLCNGKGRMKALSKTFKSIGIDFRIIPDLDFFNDEVTVREIYKNCGGNWETIKNDYRILFDAMNQPDGTMLPDDFVKVVREMIDERGWLEMTKHHASRLGRDIPQILENQWDKLKHNGISYIKDQEVRVALMRLISAMNKVGVFPVVDGELECFFPEVGSHGPGYAVAVLDKYPDLNDNAYDKLRKFVDSWGI